MRSTRRTTVALALLTALSPAGAAAQAQDQSSSESGVGVGLKAGFGIDPEQFVLGAQYSIGRNLGIFRVVPNFDIGFGGKTTVDFAVDLLARLKLEDSGFAFYIGGAPTLGIVDGDVNPGIAVVAGTQLMLLPRNPTNIEVRLGIGDIPDLRILLTLIL